MGAARQLSAWQLDSLVSSGGGDVAQRKMQSQKIKGDFQGALQQFQASSQVAGRRGVAAITRRRLR